jgi:nicotinamidase-related amidase
MFLDMFCGPYFPSTITRQPMSKTISTTPALTAASRVLLVVDVQANMLADPPRGVHSAAMIHRNISHILEVARSVIPPPLVIHVRNTGDKGDPDEPNTPGWQPVFPPLAHEPIIDKLECNSFAGTKLGELIEPDAEIVVVGMQSDFCIRETCIAAVGRGNKVMLVREAHATYDGEPEGKGGIAKAASTVEQETESELKGVGVVLTDMSDVPGILAGVEESGANS